MNVLVLNTGSATIKCSLVDAAGRQRLSSASVDWSSSASDQPPPLTALVRRAAVARVDALAHRVVHGGPSYSAPARLTVESIQAIEAASALAPLHNAPALAIIHTALAQYPDLPQLAVFDTAFHHHLPDHARHYAVPRRWRDDHGVRRYGFHGISHASVARQTAELLQRPLESLRLVSLHLGNGASAAAIAGGRSIDTSMGMTPLEGLVMGTRSGDLDTAAALHVARREQLSLSGLEDTLTRHSGLMGLCGDSDLRTVLSRSATGDRDAVLALAIYSYRIRKYIGAYTAAMGGIDALVFTGGVGENAPAIRSMVCEGMAYFGIALDHHANQASEFTKARAIQAAEASVAVVVAPSDEDMEIARQAGGFLAPRATDRPRQT